MSNQQQPNPYTVLEHHAAAPVTPLLVSQTEAARLLGVERTTVWRMLKRGELDSVTIGSRRLVTMASLEALVAVACRTATDQGTER